jgi:survival of motor neuron-related-splicing factor 30
MAELAEYMSQLSDVEALLQQSPDDEALVSLKNDLLELIEITRGAGTDQASRPDVGSAPSPDGADQGGEPPNKKGQKRSRWGLASENSTTNQGSGGMMTSTAVSGAGTAGPSTIPEEYFDMPATNDTDDNAAANSASKKGKKSLALPDTFEIPAHLIPLESDTDKERNRKRRTIKALKSKWKEQKKEAESSLKQKSWQSFQKKSIGRSKAGVSAGESSSIFSTAVGEDGSTKVGVVSAPGKR